MRTVYAQKNKKIILGRQGEDKAVRVVWPGIVSDWSSLYGDGSFQLSVRRFGDENAYPVVVEVNGDDIRFTVTSAETAIAGNGKCELTYIANGTVAKSATWETVVLNSLTGQTPSEPPEEPAKSWFTAIQGQIGNLANLETTSKDNLVSAINEAAQSGGGSGGASVELDTTLTHSGKAADAKAVGDALAEKQPKGDYLTQNELPDMTAYRTAEAQDVIDAGKQDTLIQSGAAVGQIAKITAVDDTGKPTAWQAVDMPSGKQRRIAEITVAEPVKKITVNKDINGNSFSLSEVSIFAYAGEAEEVGYSYARFLVNENDSIGNFHLVVTKKTISCFFRIREDGTGMVVRTEQNEWNNFDKINLCSARVSYVLNGETNFGGAITDISMEHAHSDGLIAAGSTIIVWGR